jgi:hypothetical protein
VASATAISRDQHEQGRVGEADIDAGDVDRNQTLDLKLLQGAMAGRAMSAFRTMLGRLGRRLADIGSYLLARHLRRSPND